MGGFWVEPWRCEECGEMGTDNGCPDACPSCGTRDSCLPFRHEVRVVRTDRKALPYVAVCTCGWSAGERRAEHHKADADGVEHVERTGQR